MNRAREIVETSPEKDGIFLSELADMEQIAVSGQCFRIERSAADAHLWKVIAFDRILEVRQENSGCRLHCSSEDFQKYWRNYFDLDTDYQKIKEKIIASGDPYLTAAINCGGAIRILRQDPWEMMVTFLISQRNNIPRIRRIVKNLCRPFGAHFPSASELKYFSENDFKKLGLGYRVAFLKKLVEEVICGRLNIADLKNLNYSDLMKTLKNLYGVGDKVANCIALFGFHKIEAFPIDIWIQKIIEKRYGGRFDVSKFEGYAGIVQQYMYFYERWLQKRC